MNITLPNIETDMTFYSWLAAVHMLNGYPSAYQLSQELMSSGTAGTRIDFPSNLAKFCKLTSNAIGDPYSIATNHTILPYFLTFRENTLDKSLALMAGPSVEELRLLIGIQPAHAYQATQLKYCPSCLSDDKQTVGYGYWHRVHQLQTSHVCLSHGEALRLFPLRERGKDANQFALPFHSKLKKPTFNNDQELLTSISQLSTKVLGHDHAFPFSPIQLNLAYRFGLKNLGLLTNRKLIKAQRLLDQLRLYFSPIKHHPQYRAVLADHNLKHFLKLLRKPRGFHHPVSHILMIQFLFGSWELFLSSAQWNHQFELSVPEQESTSNFLGEGVRSILDKHHEGSSLKTIALEHNVTIETVTRHLERVGKLKVNRRPKLLNDSIIRNVITLLEKGTPQKEITSITGLSRSTIDRICCRHPQAHHQWKIAKNELKKANNREEITRFASQNEVKSPSEFRKHIPSVLAWLTKYDANWLNTFLEQFPSKRGERKNNLRKPRVNWSLRDDECLAALKRVNLSDLETWERKTPNIFLRRLTNLTFNPILSKLPKSKAWIDNALHSMVRDF